MTTEELILWGENLAEEIREKRRAKKSASMMGKTAGTQHGLAKLTDVQVAEIRVARAQGEALKTLAGRYGVHVATISKVARGVRWGHI
jgi:hypothetical protein